MYIAYLCSGYKWVVQIKVLFIGEEDMLRRTLLYRSLCVIFALGLCIVVLSVVCLSPSCSLLRGFNFSAVFLHRHRLVS